MLASSVHILQYGPELRAEMLYEGVGMIRAEIGLKNRQIIHETYSFRFFLIL
jgi:hypothetical protein